MVALIRMNEGEGMYSKTFLSHFWLDFSMQKRDTETNTWETRTSGCGTWDPYRCLEL